MSVTSGRLLGKVSWLNKSVIQLEKAQTHITSIALQRKHCFDSIKKVWSEHEEQTSKACLQTLT